MASFGIQACAVELARETPLFDRSLSVQLSNGIAGSSINAGETVLKVASLVFRIIAGTRSVGSAGQSEKVYHFEVTDENDLYFLYSLDVGEGDFHHLKREQSLLVEFHVFPFKLIELLELCLSRPTNISSEGGINSTFLTKLDTSTGILSVVEANMFKQLTHIYLQMRPGNDSSVKSYLASRLSLSLSTSQKQGAEIEALHTFLSNEREMNAKLTKELTELKNYRESDVQTLTSHHTQEVSQLQMQNIELMEQARVRYENQIESLRNTLDAIQKEVQTKAATFEQTTSDLNFDKSQLEFKVRDLTRQLAGAEEDRERMNNEYQKMYSSRHVVEEARLNLERDLAKNVTKVESLLQQLRDKDEMIQTTTALHKASEESRLSTEQRLEMYVSNGEVMQEKLKQTAVEIDKGNNVISLLQNEIKQLRDKVKMKSDVIRRQEVLVTELRNKISDTERVIQSLNESNNLAKSNNASLQRSLDDANEKLSESMKLIASNQEVITYLNEEINKWQLGLRSHTAMNASSVITPTRYFHGNSLTQSPDSVILQGRTPLITSNQTSKLYSSTSNEMADLNLSDTGVDKDTLLKGLSNLGLSEASFGYDAGIESLDYYATGVSANKSLLSAQSGASKKKNYDWQRDSFQ